MTPQEAAKAGAAGAAPQGAVDQQSAAKLVQQMFTEVAPRYDLLNHVLSCNVDRLWWWRAARCFAHILKRPEARALDLCCGTGDMTLALAKYRPASGVPILAADFARPMLARAAVKVATKNIRVLESDALQMPLPDASVDLIVSAFGFRNLADYEMGLREIYRLLRPEGEVGILEC